MAMPLKKSDRKYTWEDYKTWPAGERWEIIEGAPYCMSPAPSTTHQKIVLNIALKAGGFFEKHPCRLFIAPTDVALDEYNVVQPDIFVVCDLGKIKERNVEGAPDMVIEVLSPATRLKDKREKKLLYERFGVREYCLINPDEEIVERYHLAGSRYEAADIINWDESLTFNIFPELTVNLWEIFEKPLPSEEQQERK